MPQAEMAAGLDLFERAGDAFPHTVVVPHAHHYVVADTAF
jgi:hypothetical protein